MNTSEIQSAPGPQTCAAIVAAQAAVAPVEKGSTNTFHKYKYASGDDIIAEGRAALNAAGLAAFATRWEITETPFQWTDEKDVVHDDVALRLAVRYRLVHTSGEVMDFEPFSVPVLPEKGRPIDKAEAGARTYALSYFLRDLLLIPRVDEGADVDQRDDSRHTPRQQTKAAAPPQRAPEQRPHVQATAETKPAATPQSARSALLRDFPAVGAEADAILARDGDDAGKLADLRRLYAHEKARTAPADPALVAQARKLLAAAEDPPQREAIAEIVREYTRGSGRVEDVGAGDLGAFCDVHARACRGSA